MNDSAKQAILVLVVSLTIFYVVKPKKEKKANETVGNKSKMELPNEEDFDLNDPIMQDAYLAVCGYINAYNDGVTQKELDDLNNEIGKKLDMKIFKISNNKLAVEDLQGNELLTVKV